MFQKFVYHSKNFVQKLWEQKKDRFFKGTSHHLARKTKTVLNIESLHLITDFFWGWKKWTSIVALSASVILMPPWNCQYINQQDGDVKRWWKINDSDRVLVNSLLSILISWTQLGGFRVRISVGISFFYRGVWFRIPRVWWGDIDKCVILP